MLKSKKLNRFFNDTFGLNIQTVIDSDLLKYFYELYGRDIDYQNFEKHVLDVYGGVGEGLLNAKDEMVFSAIKEVISRNEYYVFNSLNTQGLGVDVTSHSFLYLLIEKGKYQEFIDIAVKIPIELKYEAKLKEFFNSHTFNTTAIDKRMRVTNNFIKELEDDLADSLVLNEWSDLRNFVKNFALENKEDFENFYEADIQNTSNFFSRRFTGKFILSIDLKKANHQALRHLKAVKDESFDSFISNHSNDKYLIRNKGLRQFIYGNLNPGRMSNFQKVIMTKLAIEIQKLGKKVYLRSDDELIVILDKDLRQCLPKLKLSTTILKEAGVFQAIKTLRSMFDKPLEFNVDVYKLQHLESDKGDFFYKDYGCPFEIKGVASTLYPQVYKKLKGLPIQDEDLMFEAKNEKQIVKFINPIKFIK